MFRATICAGTAGLLSLGFVSQAAVAEAPLESAEFVSSERSRTSISLASFPGEFSKLKLSESVSYADVLSSAENHPNVFVGEALITELLNDTSLTPDEHARVLYARAQHRWKKSSNKVGAWEDFTQFAKLYPEDPYATNAGIEAGYVSDQISYIETQMDQLQTLSEWFEDAWELGERDYIVERFKRSGLTPEPAEIALLQSAGLICENDINSRQNSATPVSVEAPDLYWCR